MTQTVPPQRAKSPNSSRPQRNPAPGALRELGAETLIRNQSLHRSARSIGPAWCADTEACALGAVILDPLHRFNKPNHIVGQDNAAHLQVLEIAMSRLTAAHFYGPQNRATFAAVQRLWARRHFDDTPLFIDTILVKEQLVKMGCFREGETMGYLLMLCEMCPAPSNIGRYCDRLERLRQLRELRYLHEELGGVMDPAHDPAEIIAALRAALESIEHGGTRATTEDGKTRLRGLLPTE